MWRHIASNALTFFVVALFLLGGFIGWGTQQYSAAGPLSQAICLRVPSGSNIGRVSDELSDLGAVSSPAIFRIGADYSEKSNRLKAGSFLIREGASMEQILDEITGGGQSTCGTEITYRVGITATSVRVRELDPVSNGFVEIANFRLGEEEAPAEYLAAREEGDSRYTVAITEGVTSWQAVTGLNALDLLDGDVSEIPPEGSLAPESYDFSPGDSVAGLLDKMSADQVQILAELWANRAPDLPLASPEEALVLASIVEKETGVPNERRQVSSVFINRLNRGMKLQTDPTVIYGVTEGQGVLGRGLRESELRRETPWNTYVIPALPPTPIANPGRASIEAALNPDTTPYIFFVADGTGGHAFAETLDQHNSNVARWRVIEAERAGN